MVRAAPRRARAPTVAHLQQLFPISDIDPFPELESHFGEMRHFVESAFFVQRDACFVRQGDAADRHVQPVRFQRGQQCTVQTAAEPAVAASVVEIDRDFRGKAVRGPALPRRGVRVSDGLAVLAGVTVRSSKVTIVVST